MKKRLERTAALMLVLAMALSMLTGCGSGSGLGFGNPKDPTAKELIDGASRDSMGAYADMSMDMTVRASEDGTDTELGMSMGIEASDSVAHIYDSEMTIGASGFSMTIQLEGWTDVKTGESYMNMSMMGETSGWMKSDGSSVDVGSFTDMAGTDWLETDEDAYMLREHKKGEDWVVTWTVPGDAFDKMLEGAEAGIAADPDASFKGDLLVEAHFDEESRELKSIAVGGNADGMELSAVITVKSRGDKVLAIPAAVIEEAEANSAGAGDFGGYDGDDGGFSYGGGDGVDGYGEGNIVSDGEGSDAYMDAFAQSVLDAGYFQGNVRVYHYSYETEVSWEWQSYDGNVMIGAEASHILDGGFSTAMEEFLSDCDFTASWLDCEGPYKGSPDDGWAAYYIDKDYVRELDYVRLYEDQDIVLSVDVYSYEDGSTAEDLWSELQVFLAAHGL